MSEAGAAASEADAATSPPPRLRLEGVARRFHQARIDVPVLSDVSLSVRPGEVVALLGSSGSGKSTLLHISGLLDRPTAGAVFLDGKNVTALPERERTRLRRVALGFVYQYHYLLADFTALENLMIPQRLNGVAAAPARRHAKELLEMIGLGERLAHRPGRLSGGEQQRVALCRAIINKPRLVLADEPTGNLDPENARRALSLMQSLVRGAGVSALIATHNHELASRMDRTLTLEGGRIREGSV